MSRAHSIPSGRVALEVDGPSVSPENVDAPAFLELASAFFSLLAGNAKQQASDVSLNGIYIHDKCVALSSSPDKPELGRFLADLSQKQIEGKVKTPRGLVDARDRICRAIRKLPNDYLVRILADDWESSVNLEKQEEEQTESHISIRATAIRITGKPYATIRLESKLEPRNFSLRVTREQARGIRVLTDIDISAIVKRDSTGHITDGTLIDFESVSTANDAEEKWREWYKEHASAWDQIPDIENELKR